GRERLHAGAGGGALRDPTREGARLHRPQGRYLRQHRGRSGDRRQDGRSADRAVRVARGALRARRRGLGREAAREPAQVRGRVALAIRDGRFALAQEDGVVVGDWSPEFELRLRDADVVAHDFKSLPRLTMQPSDDTMIAAYLIEPGRPVYELDDLAREYG